MESTEEYLNTNVKPIMESLAESVMIANPEDHVSFFKTLNIYISKIGYMIDWLQKFIGKKNDSQLNTEKHELIELRNEVNKYKKKYHNECKELEVHSESDCSDNEEHNDKIDDITSINKKRNHDRARSSVCAEVYGQFNIKKEFVPKVIPKKLEQKKRLENLLSKNFMFNSLDNNDFETVINAIEEARFSTDEIVVKEGDKGDVMYIVEEGSLICLKNINGEIKQVKSYSEGESFGELALLYNAPRAATIKTITNCVLWSLDRETFNNIVKDAAVKKREQYETFFKQVNILKDLSQYELMQICDAVKTIYYRQGELIIKEHDQGDNFYILAEGKVYAEKVLSYGENPSVVKDYNVGDYFGELALIKDEPRAASVIAKVRLYNSY